MRYVALPPGATSIQLTEAPPPVWHYARGQVPDATPLALSIRTLPLELRRTPDHRWCRATYDRITDTLYMSYCAAEERPDKKGA